MICCKIVTNFGLGQGKFGDLLNGLGKYGEILWAEESLYFADVENVKTNKSTVSRVLKKCGYKEYYIEEYNKDNPPKKDEYVGGWLYDRLVKIAYVTCEIESQKAFREIAKGLDMLDAEVEEMYKQKAEAQEAEQQNSTKEDDGA